ncbi:sensor histidine kinase [Martelella alba]|uniref:histidine kinase n=1 Tax=Martelella alba TaxID=2590451 RepID=A0ABY2SRM6_9HYPH|nr:ATP-binding protein [Martelella alba]TKI08862.1 sensor histidine kinase [Martelella alba]
MASFKKRIKNSIQGQLTLALSLAIIIIALISGGLTFASALDEAHELQDRMLQQMAIVIQNAPAARRPQEKWSLGVEDDKDARIFVDDLSLSGSEWNGNTTHFHLSPAVTTGFHNIDTHSETYRVLVTKPSSKRMIAIGQQTDVRDDIAFKSALRTLIPFSITLPVLVLVAVLLIRHSLKPVTTLANEVRQRDEIDLTPLTKKQIPNEILPFISGINRLLGKVDYAMQAQKRFIADAAHELRTPITALILQAERLSGSPMSTEASERLIALRLGLKRTKNLLEQLLALARQQQTNDGLLYEWISIDDIFRQVLETLLPLALEKKIDIGISSTSQSNVSVFTEKNALYTALKNLTENAVRYIPEGGQIDLHVHKTGAHSIIAVEDNGPGIDKAMRTRVFDAFYRIEGAAETGSGLGLSIVQACIAKMGGVITLLDSPHFTSGLMAKMVIPDKKTGNASVSSKYSKL